MFPRKSKYTEITNTVKRIRDREDVLAVYVANNCTDFAKILAAVKAIPGREWQRTKTRWLVPVTEHAAIIRLIKAFRFGCTDEAKKILVKNQQAGTASRQRQIEFNMPD